LVTTLVYLTHFIFINIFQLLRSLPFICDIFNKRTHDSVIKSL